MIDYEVKHYKVTVNTGLESSEHFFGVEENAVWYAKEHIRMGHQVVFEKVLGGIISED